MKNNNSAIIRKITTRTLLSDKKRNFFVVVAIMLTTFMLASVFSIGISYYKTLQKQQTSLMGTTAHAGITKPTPHQLNKLASLPYIREYGTGNFVASVKNTPVMGDMNLSLFTFDKTSWEKMRAPAYDDIVGSYPQKANEIMFPLWVLEKMGIDTPEIGVQIPLKYTVTDGDERTEHSDIFTLSGYFKSYMHIRSANVDSLLVSKELSDKYSKSVDVDGSATVIFDNPTKTLEYCELLKLDLSIMENQDVRAIPMYDVSISEQITGLISVGSIAVFLMFVGFLLIYNVMFISVSRDIRFYGMLKTVGTTPKQLRRIVTGQIVRLCIIGIPLGVALAAAVSLVIVPLVINGIGSSVDVQVKVSFSPLIYLGAAALSLITAFVGALKPSQKVATISPIEALKFSDAEVQNFKTHGATHAKPHKMALRNVFRDKKRAAIVLLSLVISMTTFISVTTLVTSMDTDNYVASYMKNDFKLNNNTAMFFNGDTKQAFTPQLLEQLQALSGFENMELDTQSIFYITYTNYFEKHLQSHESIAEKELESVKKYFSSVFVGIDSAPLDELNKTITQPYDVDAFERGDYVLIATNTPEFYDGLTSIEVRPMDSQAKTTLKVGGFVPLLFKNNTSSVAPTVICSNTLMKKLLGSPIIKTVNLNVKNGYDVAALETIRELTDGNNEISHSSKIEMREEMRNIKILLYSLGGGISLILGLIGIMNFVNIMSVGIMVRRRELATLESVGMGKKQMKKMLVWEGGWYALLTLAFVATLGNLAVYGVFSLFKQQADYAVFTYPTIPVLIASVIIALICALTPQIAYSSVSKLSLVERLRESE